MAKGNRDYWRRRFEALEDDQYRKSAAYYKDIQEQFRRASNSIQMDIERWYGRLAENNDISYAAAKRLLKRAELEEFQWDVGEYIKAGEENAVDGRWMKELENASARHHISYLEVMKLQARQHVELLSVEFEGGMENFLHKSYAEGYYRTAFEMARGTGVGTNLARLDTRRIDAVIRKPWAQDGADFSDRIWTNRKKLVQNLHTELTQGIIRGESPQGAISRLAKAMDVGRAQAGRLIMTESAAVASAAQKDTLKELGVGQYEVLATLDSRTSETCRGLDGKVFDMGDYVVGSTAPPFHPNCRSTTVPYFDDKFTAGEERAAREEGTGKTYYVPGDMKYGEWEKKYVDNRDGKFYNMPKGADLSDWKKKVINTSQNEDAVLANRNYQRGKEYQENCQRCVPAYEMRRRGFDVTANPVVYAGDPIEDTWAEVFDGAKWKRYASGNGLTHIKEEMQKFGDGARAEVYVEWDGPPGSAPHVFVAEQVNGSTVFIDPQNGDSDVERYFSYVKQGETRMCRIDNLVASDKIFECCEEYK